jgi:2-oxoglutarate dehydrogenase E2 component (dihydrolipoamide succinyltransferase)
MSVTISMPQLGETVTEGTILAWIKEIGEYVAEDDILVEISTDKVDTEIPSPAHGVLTEILVAAGTTIDVGTPICVLSEADEELPAVSAQEPGSESQESRVKSQDEEAVSAHADVTVESREPVVTQPQNRGRRGVISPVVRKLAGEHNIDLAMVPGTGDGGRITRKDIESFIDNVPPSGGTGERERSAFLPSQGGVRAREPGTEGVDQQVHAPPAPVAVAGEVREIPRLRSLIAENMIIARKSAAHVWTSVEVDYERVVRVRSANKEAFTAAEGFSLTYLPFIARATMEALAAFPVVNSELDLEAGTHTYHRQVNLGLAIDLEQKGLIVANIPAADSMTLRAIARSVSATALAARGNKLGPDDLHGFTFSITNPGPYGSFMSAPIIPPPNAAILSTDTITKRPVVVEMPDGSDGIAIHHIGYLGLSWDHRVFDGSTAVLFLNRIKDNLETWDWEQELK